MLWSFALWPGEHPRTIAALRSTVVCSITLLSEKARPHDLRIFIKAAITAFFGLASLPVNLNANLMLGETASRVLCVGRMHLLVGPVPSCGRTELRMRQSSAGAAVHCEELDFGHPDLPGLFWVSGGFSSLACSS